MNVQQLHVAPCSPGLLLLLLLLPRAGPTLNTSEFQLYDKRCQ